MHEQECCHDEAVNHQLPIAVAVFIVLHLSTQKNIEVVLHVNYLVHRGILMMDNSFPIKQHLNMVLILLQLCCTFFRREGAFHWGD